MKKVLIYSVENDEDHRIITMTDSQYKLLEWLGQEEYLCTDIIFDELKPKDIINFIGGEED